MVTYPDEGSYQGSVGDQQDCGLSEGENRRESDLRVLNNVIKILNAPGSTVSYTVRDSAQIYKIRSVLICLVEFRPLTLKQIKN